MLFLLTAIFWLSDYSFFEKNTIWRIAISVCLCLAISGWYSLDSDDQGHRESREELAIISFASASALFLFMS